MPQPIPGKMDVLVRRVFPPADPFRRRPLPDFLAADGKQRPDQPFGSREAHPGQTSRSGPPQEAEQQGLGLVAARVAEGDFAQPQLVADLKEEPAPCLPGCLFQVSRCQLGSFGKTMQTERLCQISDKRFIGVRFRPPQPVIDVQDVELDGGSIGEVIQKVQKHNRVGAPGHSHTDPAARRRHAITSDDFGNSVDKRFCQVVVYMEFHPPGIAADKVGLVVVATNVPGVLHQVTGVIAQHQGDIRSITIIEDQQAQARTYFELDLPGSAPALISDLEALQVVQLVTPVQSLHKIYGKRIIIMGGGAQVGQVALGAISEADRHNIRGEHISIDTIPLVGEQTLAAAVRAVTRLGRVRALVLAGALMGGEIEHAVREVRSQGLLVISLNMAGSVPDASDLVITDPVQAGVMAVMAVADTAKFNINRLHRRVF